MSSSSSGENVSEGGDRKTLNRRTDPYDDENNQVSSNDKTKSSPNVSDNSGSGGGGIVNRYQEVSKRRTPRIGTLFFPSIKPDGESRSYSSGIMQRPYPSSGVSGMSADQRSENSGLEKYNKYMKTHSGIQTVAAFQNLEFRRIVGQEDNSDEKNVNINPAEKGDKERKLTCRPPVVGQASSSSNDSGSYALGQHSPSPESDTHSCDEVPTHGNNDNTDLNSSAYFDHFNSDMRQVVTVSNREDYISEKPPEGSSEHESIASQPDLQHIPSPSSASSVASFSVRPLEWDSGADVGYYQVYPLNNPDVDSKLSTIERIALARGSAALLTRSDPEGTTEQNSQFVGKSLQNKVMRRKMFLKDRVGAPVAESTPINSNIVSTPPGGGEFISEIDEELSSITLPKTSVPGCDESGNKIIKSMSSQLQNNNNNNGRHFPLFPELEYGSGRHNDQDEAAVGLNNNKISQPVSIVTISKPLSSKKSDKYDKWCLVRKHFSAPEPSYHDLVSDDQSDLPSELPEKFKKLSSSMEFLNIKSNFNENEQPYTLPRSYSHNNIGNEMNVDNIHSLPKSLILRGFSHAKSASSSSVSTVVHKRKDSPKVISKLVQTSYIQQSVGTQASSVELNQYNNVSPSCKMSGNLKLPLSESLSDLNRERSNYFNQIISSDSVAGNYNSYDRTGDQFVSRHSHNGVPCSGAHKKNSTSNYNVDNQNIELSGQNELVSRVVLNGNEFQNNNMIVSEFQKAMENCNTLESIESSARSGQNIWIDRRESMGVEDRVNSFEYLPGHVFESTARKGNDSQGTGTSSVSLNRNESSRNGYSDGTDKLWDTSASSTLLRDIERGVNLMNDFVKNSTVHDDHLKQKLLKKVVEKLLRTEYSEDKLWMENLVKGLPWISPQLHAEVCDGRETRRSHNKEKQLNDASTSEKSSSRGSSECFQQQNLFAEDSKFPRETAEKCIGTDQLVVSNMDLSNELQRRSVQSTSSDIITESSSSSVKPKSTVDESSQYKNTSQSPSARSPKSKIRQSINHSEGSVNLSSNVNTDKSGSGDWRVPVSKAEKLFEEKRKKQEKMLADNGRNRKASAVLLQYLNIERENQLFWIKSEIDHLSNLKRLLEKQEELKKSLCRMRRPKARSVLTAVDNKPKLSSETSSSNRGGTYHISESEILKKTRDVPCKRNDKTQQESSDWSSHHYFSSTRSNVKTLSKSKENKSESTNSFPIECKRAVNQFSVVNNPSRGGMVDKKSSVKRGKDKQSASSDDDSDEVHLRMRRTVGTETTDTVGVQTSKSVQQLPVIRPEWYKNEKKLRKKDSLCKCKTNGFCRHCNDKNNKKHDKKSVAYYITFGESPRQDSGFEDYLLKNRADYVSRAEYRRRCVAELAYLRELRDKSKRHLITMAPESSDYSQSSTPRDLPPPPLAVKRVFSQRTMRRQTERKYRQLAEVKSRQLDMKRKEAYRTNRLMAEVFTKKLQRRTLKGEVNLSNSVSVISNI